MTSSIQHPTYQPPTAEDFAPHYSFDPPTTVIVDHIADEPFSVMYALVEGHVLSKMVLVDDLDPVLRGLLGQAQTMAKVTGSVGATYSTQNDTAKKVGRWLR